MNEWAERNTVQCEVVKIGLNQDKNGHILKVAIHPSELPKDLVLDPLGTRYVMVLARLNDQDEVVQPKEKSDADKAIDIAGLLCRDNRFISWMFDHGHSPERTEEGAKEGVREYNISKDNAVLAQGMAAYQADIYRQAGKTAMLSSIVQAVGTMGQGSYRQSQLGFPALDISAG